MRIVKIIDKILTFIEKYMIALLLIVMMGIAFSGVIARFVMNSPLSWGDELSRYLSIWAVFLGASLGVRRGAHIGVEAFIRMVPKNAQQYITILTTLVCIVFCCAVTFVGYDYALRLLKTGQLSPAMRIPIVWAYAAVPVGCLLMTIRYFMLLIEQIVNLKGNDSNYLAGGEVNK